MVGAEKASNRRNYPQFFRTSANHSKYCKRKQGAGQCRYMGLT